MTVDHGGQGPVKRMLNTLCHNVNPPSMDDASNNEFASAEWRGAVKTDTLRFSDRVDAGRQLASALDRFVGGDTVVVGLARGGIPVAAEVAARLNAPLDVLLVRKLGAPFQPELGVGALAEGGVQVIDTVMCEKWGITDADVRRMVRARSIELDARTAVYRQDHPRRDVTGRLVIIVDDGLATGSTAHAAIRSMRRAGARSVVLAVPVGSIEAVRRLEDVADEVICLDTPADFTAVGNHYDDFSPVLDPEVLSRLGAPLSTEVLIPMEDVALPGILSIPPRSRLLVIFAHGSGSGRLSPRNAAVARILNAGGIATLLLDLLTESEAEDRDEVFDIDHLANRLEGAVAWTRHDARTVHLGVALFGASTGAAAALAVAARCPDIIRSVVSRGGRPDLARSWLARVQAPTLLIVGGDDVEVLRLNREALTHLTCPTSLEIVPGAGHLFEEPGALRRVAMIARDWLAATAVSRAA
jgi:putative phosphoribosyl transferase